MAGVTENRRLQELRTKASYSYAVMMAKLTRYLVALESETGRHEERRRARKAWKILRGGSG